MSREEQQTPRYSPPVQAAVLVFGLTASVGGLLSLIFNMNSFGALLIAIGAMTIND